MKKVKKVVNITKKPKLKTAKLKNINLNTINDNVYLGEKKTSKQFSVFTSLNILNRNNDLFKFTKNTVSSSIRNLYTVSEIKNLIEKTNSNNFDNLVKNIQKALQGKNNSIKFTNIAYSISDFITKVRNNEIKYDAIKNFNKTHTKSLVNKFPNNTKSLIEQVNFVYGENRYFLEKIETENKTMTPLFTKFEKDTEGLEKLIEIEKSILNTYGLKIKVSNKSNFLSKVTKTLNVKSYESNMDMAVNMLYSVAKTFVGSKKLSYTKTKNLILKNEDDEFLKHKYINYNNDNVKTKDLFNYHKDTISDVIATLTTIFMCRFVFDNKYFADIERDLTEQACLKMKTLKISSNPENDYWINQLIQENLKLNISQVLASNNITSAKQLIEVYNNNGTTIVNPENVLNLEDLVFTVQYSGKDKVNIQTLENAIEPTFDFNNGKSVVKNTKEKVKPAKPNSYLDEIRKSDLYKKYYEEYMNEIKFEKELEDLSLIAEVQEQTNKNLTKLAKIAETPLSENRKEDLIDAVAQNDAVKDKIDDILNNENSSEKVVDNQEEKANTETIESTEENEKRVVSFKAEKSSKQLTEDLLLKKINKYYTGLIIGKNGKAGIIGTMLSYRVTNSKTKNQTENDSVRLDDADFNKANKIRDAVVLDVINTLSKSTLEYFKNNKEKCENLTVNKLCLSCAKDKLELPGEEILTNKKFEKYLSIVITKKVNEELKDLNMELYTGKKTYKKYQESSDKLMEVK